MATKKTETVSTEEKKPVAKKAPVKTETKKVPEKKPENKKTGPAIVG